MESFNIVVDSSVDAGDWQPPFAPIHVYAGAVHMLDKKEFTITELKRALNRGAPLRTSAPSVKDWMNVYESVGKDKPILAITLSKHISASYNSAVAAARIMAKRGYDVRVFDSLSGSAASGLLALRAREMSENGIPIDDAIKELEALRARTEIWLVLADPEAAARSGRFPMLAGKIARFLRVKLVFDVENGVFVKKAVFVGDDRAILYLTQVAKDAEQVVVGVAGENPAADRLRATLRVAGIDSPIWQVDPALAVHLGYGVYGVALIR